jgi:hypothetical protein
LNLQSTTHYDYSHQDGANIVVCAKTTEAHSKLEGTIYSAAEEIEKVWH